MLPVGAGLVVFDGVDDAAEAIGAVLADYQRHAEAARQIAEPHLDSRKVLAELMEGLLA